MTVISISSVVTAITATTGRRNLLHDRLGVTWELSYLATEPSFGHDGDVAEATSTKRRLLLLSAAAPGHHASNRTTRCLRCNPVAWGCARFVGTTIVTTTPDR